MVESPAEFNKNRVKGDNAESVFSFLIESLGEWEIIKYGIENHIHVLKNSLKGDYSDTAEKIRSMPDYAIINKKENKVMLFEVKRISFIDKRKPDQMLFRFKKGIIERYIKYWGEAKLFIVQPAYPFFYLIDVKDIDIKKHRSRVSFRSEKELDGHINPIQWWNFKDIQYDVKKLFPTLKDETIEVATKDMILPS